MWRELVLRVMRVPPRPEPPPGSPPRVFRASPNFLTLKWIGWGAGELLLAFPLTAFTIFLLTIGADNASDVPLRVLKPIAAVTWTVYAIQFIWTAAVLRLDFELRWYMVSDRAIRIREGISVVREKTIALANVQNISLRQGPLQRLLGIADVEVTSAGGGAQSNPHGKKNPFEEPMHIAKFRGVDNAEEIRDLLSEGVRRQRSTGLGDPDEAHHAPGADDESGAAAMLLEGARRLRRVAEALGR